MKRLIVTADDVGLDRGMNEGAIRAHREGIVTACSIVANGRAFDDAVARLRDVPALEAGVHLALVEEASLTGIALPRNYVEFIAWYATGRLKLPAVLREMRAQIERVAATGLRITHLNGHQHLHVIPSIFAAVRDLAGEFGIGYIRRVDDRDGHGPLLRRGSMAVLNLLGRRAAGSNDCTIGVMEAGHLTGPRIIELLSEAGELTELVTHPGVSVAGYAHWRYAWDEETRALCDPAVAAALADNGIDLVTPAGTVRPPMRH